MTAAIRQPIGTGLAPGVARVEVTELGRCAILVLQLFFVPATPDHAPPSAGRTAGSSAAPIWVLGSKASESAAFERFTA